MDIINLVDINFFQKKFLCNVLLISNSNLEGRLRTHLHRTSSNLKFVIIKQ